MSSLDLSLTLNESNLVQQPKGRAIVAMFSTTAKLKNLTPLQLANAYWLQGFDRQEEMARFGMAVAVNRRRTQITNDLLTDSDTRPQGERLVPEMGTAAKKDVFCFVANATARKILSQHVGPDYVNANDSLEEEIAQHVVDVTNFPHFPLIAIGFAWTLTWKVMDGDNRTPCTDERAYQLASANAIPIWKKEWQELLPQCTPFGTFRTLAKIAAEPMVNFFRTKSQSVYLHVGDSDPVSLRFPANFGGGRFTGLITRFHASLDECAEEPVVLTGGYRVNVGDTEGCTTPLIAAAVDQEMAVRKMLYDVHADLPYYSEANLLIRCSDAKEWGWIHFGGSELEWNAYRSKLVNAKVITYDSVACGKALRWDPRCVITTHAGRIHDTFFGSPPKLAREVRPTDKWTVSYEQKPVMQLMLMRQESIVCEYARKTNEFLSRVILGQVVQASIGGSGKLAMMMFRIAKVEHAMKPLLPLEPAADVRRALVEANLVGDLALVGAGPRSVTTSGGMKSLTELAFDVLTPLTQVAMSSAKFKGLRMGAERVAQPERIIGLKQFYLLGIFGSHNSVEPQLIDSHEPYSIGLLPHLLAHTDIDEAIETIFRTVFTNIGETQQHNLLQIKNVEASTRYKFAENVLLATIREAVGKLYEKDLEPLVKKALSDWMGSVPPPAVPLSDVIPIVVSQGQTKLCSPRAVRTDALIQGPDLLPAALHDLVNELAANANLVINVKSCVLAKTA